MTIYVAEIEGRAIAAFGAETEIGAEEVAEAEWFQADLMCLESGGQPLWNGVSEINIRKASADERKIWKRSAMEAEKRGEDSEDWLVFLVATSDPVHEEIVQEMIDEGMNEEEIKGFTELCNVLGI